MSAVKEVIDSLKQVSLDRLRSPLLGSYALAWMAFNWKTWTTFIFSKEPI